MSVTTVVQQTIVDTVGSVTMSAITQDPVTNLFMRTITVNSPPDSGGNIVAQFTLTVKGATQASVELSLPTAVVLSAPSGSV